MSEGTTDFRYVGRYGRGHHRAYCSGIGEVFYGQILSLTQEQIDSAPKADWVKVGNFCRHTDMSGNLCWNNKEEGSTYCSIHSAEFKIRSQLDEENLDQEESFSKEESINEENDKSTE